MRCVGEFAGLCLVCASFSLYVPGLSLLPRYEKRSQMIQNVSYGWFNQGLGPIT